MKYFELGQKPFDFKFGEGVVIGVESVYGYYPIKVRFKDSEQDYTADGKHITGCLYISLFQTAPIITPNVPIIEFEQGELVWVRNIDNCITMWIVRFFSHKEGNHHYCFVDQKREGRTELYTEIKKITDNPLLIK